MSDNHSDDDAPAEVTLSASRAAALQQLHEEELGSRQNKRLRRSTRNSQESKGAAEPQDVVPPHSEPRPKRERKRPQHKADVTAATNPESANAEKLDEHAANVITMNGTSNTNSLDVLPESALAELIAKSRGVHKRLAGASLAVAADAAEGRRQGRARKHQNLSEVKKGPVVVKVLKAIGDAKPSASAKSFLDDHLKGKRLRRSFEMLRSKTSLQVFAPAPKFT